jgi:hypothetical protein
LGSGPQNDVRISDDASIVPCHIQLTVGKRYTLLKAIGPIRISGRPIREWLIDQSTVVECGSRWLVIHPNKQTTLAVVTHDRLSKIAERLASLNIPPSTPSDCKPAKDSEALVEEFRNDVLQDLSSLRDTVNAILSRIEELPDVGALESKMEQTASEALLAFQEELPRAVGDPIRAELLEVLNSQRSSLEEILNHRQQQIEASIQTVTSGFDQSLRSTTENLDRLQSQLAKLADDQGDLRALFSRLESDQVESNAAIERLTVAPSQTGENSPIATQMEPITVQHFDDAATGVVAFEAETPGVMAPDAIYASVVTEISSPHMNVESDEVFEFQVDDESISQRLSRMLSEPNERRSTTTRTKLTEELQKTSDTPSPPPTDPSSPFGEHLDPEAIYTALSELSSSKVGLASTSEDAAQELPEDALESPFIPMDARSTFEREELEVVGTSDSSDHLQEPYLEQPPMDATQFVAVVTDQDNEEEAIHEASIKNSASSFPSASVVNEDSGEEDSIEEYMQRLLQRVRTGAGAGEPSGFVSADSMKQPGESVDRASVTRGTSGVHSGLSASASGISTSTRNRLTADNSTPQSSRTRSEVKSDIEALREIANSNARRAINRSVIRRKSSNVIIKGAVVVISLVCAIAMFLMNGFRVTATLGGFIIALVIAVLWGIDTAREAISLIDEKKQREADDQNETSTASAHSQGETLGIINE